MSMRSIILCLCALVFLVGCGGDDGDGNGDADTAAPANTEVAGEATESDTESDSTDSGGSVEILTVNGGAPDQRADTTVRTTANAECTLTYTTPDGQEGTEQGLGAKTASGNGRVSWSWRISADTTPGTGTLTVTCDGATAEAEIVIE